MILVPDVFDPEDDNDGLKFGIMFSWNFINIKWKISKLPKTKNVDTGMGMRELLQF